MKSSLFLLLFSCTTLGWSQATSPSTPANQKPQAPASAPANQAPSTAASPGQLKARGPEAVAQQDPKRIVATIEGKQISAQQALDMIKPVRPEDRKRFEGNLSVLVQ